MGRPSLFTFLKDQFTELELISADLKGKTVIVTGGNVGLGFETAKHFARMKPEKLILGCRDIKKSEEAMNDIRISTGIKEELMAWRIDQLDFSSVLAFVRKFETETDGRLDILVANAGVATEIFQKTSDGHEYSLQVNHLSTALLCLLLLPAMLKTKASGPTPRVVILSSDMHHAAVPFEEGLNPHVLKRLSDSEYSTPSYALAISSLAFLNIMFTRSLVAHLPLGSPLTVVSLNPGLCQSTILRDQKGLQLHLILLCRRLVGRTCEMGSRAIVWGALGGENDAVQGRYLASCQIREENEWILGKEGQVMQENIWNETLELLGPITPAVKEIVSKYLMAI
ncbi:hypothetical protein BU17DRAFT_39929 [Hysterangium stoloniferum]|nr:hypothetical protein BU17DRAFT_39929 [Hysterangium stoloniferum]